MKKITKEALKAMLSKKSGWNMLNDGVKNLLLNGKMGIRKTSSGLMAATVCAIKMVCGGITTWSTRRGFRKG